jgi:drug/metabolite transporter (DMT)-like permease
MSKVTKKQTERPDFLAESADARKRSLRARFFHPYLQLSISVVLTAVAQILLKIGVDTQFVTPWYTISNFFSFWIWSGILAIIASLFSWLFALKSVPLIIAFNLAAANHIMVAIGSWLLLGEAISSRRWIGIFLVALGVFFIARPVARAEEKL